MKLKQARIGMAVIGLDDWAGLLGTIVEIVPSPYSRRVTLLKIRLAAGDIRSWHPSHWKPVKEKCNEPPH